MEALPTRRGGLVGSVIGWQWVKRCGQPLGRGNGVICFGFFFCGGVRDSAVSSRLEPLRKVVWGCLQLKFGDDLGTNLLVLPEVSSDTRHLDTAQMIELGNRDNLDLEADVGVHASE